MKIFTKERALTPSWNLLDPSIELLKKHIWHVVYLSFVPALLVGVGLVMIGELDSNATTLTTSAAIGLFIFLVAFIWSLLVFPGFTYFQAQAVRGNAPGVMESFKKGLPRLLPLIGASILAGLIVVLGLLAFIVPGLLAIRGLYMVPYYVVDQNLGPIQAIKQSYRDSLPVTAWIWGVLGVELVFAIAGGVLGNIPVVGYLLSVLIAYPYIFASALRYSEIAHNTKVDIKA